MPRKPAKTAGTPVEEAATETVESSAEQARPEEQAAPAHGGGEHQDESMGEPEDASRRPRKRLQGRLTSTLAGVEAGIDNAYGAQPYVAFDNERPATAEEKRDMDSHGEDDPKFRYRSGQEKRWTGPATREGREKAETLAEKFIAKRLAGDGAQSR